MSPKHGHGGRTAETESQGHSGAGKRKANRRGRGGAERSRRRNDRGQYVEQMTETEILDLLETLPGPVIATTDVADHFDSTTEGARRKLNDLCERDILERRKVGNTRVYWRTEGSGI